MQIPQTSARFGTQVLVLGASGRIGAILRAHWPRAAARWQWRRAPDGPESTAVVLDPLADPAALAAAAAGCGAILCLAGVVPGRGTGRGTGSGTGALADNTALARAAVHAGAASGARVLLASSAAVYGATAGAVTETTPPAPVSDYGHAKARMEAGAGDLATELGVTVTSLRIGNIAGIDAILGGWQPGFTLDLFADGRTPRRSYIGPVTLARVLGALVQVRDLPPVLNVAAPGLVEMGALLEAAGLDWTSRPAPETALAEVALSTVALERIMPLPAATAASLVAEWRASR